METLWKEVVRHRSQGEQLAMETSPKALLTAIKEGTAFADTESGLPS